MTIRQILHLWEAFRWRCRKRVIRQSYACKQLGERINKAAVNHKSRRAMRLEFARELARK